MLRVGIGRDSATGRPQPLGLSWFKPIGGKHLIDEQMSAGAKDATALLKGLVERTDVVEHLAAPNQIDARIPHRKRLGRSKLEAHKLAQCRIPLRSFISRLRSKLDVSRDGVDSMYCQAEPVRQLQGMLSLSAAQVYHRCPWREAKPAHDVIRQFRSAGMQALVEGSLEGGLYPRIVVIELVKRSHLRWIAGFRSDVHPWGGLRPCPRRAGARVD